MGTSTPMPGLFTNVAELWSQQRAFLLSGAAGLASFGKPTGGAASDEARRSKTAPIANPFGAGA